MVWLVTGRATPHLVGENFLWVKYSFVLYRCICMSILFCSKNIFLFTLSPIRIFFIKNVKWYSIWKQGVSNYLLVGGITEVFLQLVENSLNRPRVNRLFLLRSEIKLHSHSVWLLFLRIPLPVQHYWRLKRLGGSGFVIPIITFHTCLGL